MATQTQKRAFAKSFQDDLTQIIQAINHAATAIVIFGKKDFGIGEPDEITDAHLEQLGITRDYLILGAALVANLIKFVDNGEPAQADYRKTFALLRSDFGASAGTE